MSKHIEMMNLAESVAKKSVCKRAHAAKNLEEL